jgi:methylmalonyl-CoA/ethylmalonyl-CoA epimerase
MILRIDHVGIAVRKLGERLPFWSEALGMEVADVETVESEGVKVALLPAGRSRVELLEPTGDGSPVARFLAKRGEGIHHLTLGVRDLAGMLERLRERGVELSGEAPRPGAGGSSIAFLHPRSTGGVLVELVERAADVPDPRPADITTGSPILVYLRDPQEKLWGVLRRLDASGVVLEGIDLGSFDDWVSQVERNEDSVIGPSVLFVPMTRVEKVLLDRSSGDLPSLAERFVRRTGRSVGDVLDEGT